MLNNRKPWPFCFFYFYALLVGCSTCASAQVVSVQDNGRVSVRLASTALTRLAVEGDRIAVLRGVAGAYTYSNDNHNGAVFLKPTAAYVNVPFYVFVTTEQGHTYVVHLTPSPTVSAGTLLLKPRDHASVTATPLGVDTENSGPQASLIALMGAMADGRPLEGYAVTHVRQRKAIVLNARDGMRKIALRLHLKTVYVGALLQGETYALANHGPHGVRVTPSDFYQRGDAAIALQNDTNETNEAHETDEKNEKSEKSEKNNNAETVPVGGTVLLYKVRHVEHTE